MKRKDNYLLTPESEPFDPISLAHQTEKIVTKKEKGTKRTREVK